MNPETLVKIVIAVAMVACVTGFLACCTIIATCRHRPFPNAMRISLSRWCAVFFVGMAGLILNCAMGPRAPFPIGVAFDGVLGLGSVAFVWTLACAAGFACNRAASIKHQAEVDNRSFPFRGQLHGGTRAWSLLVVLVAVLAAGQLTGCASTSPFVLAEDTTYKAIAPEYGAYVTADPLLTPEQKQRRARTVKLWRSDIDEQLGAAPNAGPATQPAQ